MPKAKNVKALEESLARARAELMERVLKKLNQSATFREIAAIYGIQYHELRQYLSTMRVHMTVEEANFIREVAEHFGMLPNEAIVHFSIEGMQQAYATMKGSPDSPLTGKRRRSVVGRLYDRVVGNRGNLYTSPRPVPSAKKTAKKKATTRKKRKATKK